MRHPLRSARRLLMLAFVGSALAGCAGVRELVALPFDMAAHIAVETAKLPYETAKIGAQGLVDVVAGAMR